MKKFAFSLDKVLDFKEQTLENKNNEMAKLQSDLRELERKIDDCNFQFAQTNQKMVTALETGLSALDMASYKTYLQEINLNTKKLINQKFELVKFIDQKMAVILELKTDISGLEKLKDKKFSEYSKLIQKEQELALEEFVNKTRYNAV